MMESWSSERGGEGISIPSMAAFPPWGSEHVAEVFWLETMVQRCLPRSFCRDVAEGLTSQILILIPACSVGVNQGPSSIFL